MKTFKTNPPQSSHRSSKNTHQIGPASALDRLKDQLHPHTQKIIQRVEDELQLEQERIKEELRKCKKEFNRLGGNDLALALSIKPSDPATAKKINTLKKKIHDLSSKVLTRPSLMAVMVAKFRDIQNDDAPIALLDGLSCVQAQEKICQMLHGVMSSPIKRESVSKWGREISEDIHVTLGKSPTPIFSTVWFQNLYELDRFVREVYVLQKILKNSEKRLKSIQSSSPKAPSDAFPLLKDRQEMAKDCFKIGEEQLMSSLSFLGHLQIFAQCVETATCLYDLGLALWDGTPNKIRHATAHVDIVVADYLSTKTFDFINDDDVREEYDQMCAQIIRTQKEKRHLLSKVKQAQKDDPSGVHAPSSLAKRKL